MSNSSTFNSAKCYLVVYFNHDNTYTVLKDGENKLKNCKFANVKNDTTQKWEKGEIVFRSKNF